MKNDRFLTGILIGIAVIIVAALVLFFARRDTVDYGPEDTPEGVVQNYLLALYRQDYERAFGYLSDREGVPDEDTFRRGIIQTETEFPRATVQILGRNVRGDQADVELQIARGGGGLFSSPYREVTTALLEREDGDWRIYQMPYPFWSWDWYPNVPAKPLP